MRSSIKPTETVKSAKRSTADPEDAAFRAHSRRVAEMMAENLRAVARQAGANSGPDSQHPRVQGARKPSKAA